MNVFKCESASKMRLFVSTIIDTKNVNQAVVDLIILSGSNGGVRLFFFCFFLMMMLHMNYSTEGTDSESNEEGTNVKKSRQQTVTYAEACKIVEQESQIEKAIIGKKQVIKKLMEMVERKISEEKKKMATFIAEVINATSDVRSKTERIQTSMKAACHSVDMKYIRWEDRRGELSSQANQEG